MKASSILASVFLSSLAAAAPFGRRALATKTETVIETKVVYTTVYDDAVGVPSATAVPTVTSAAPVEQPTSEAVVEQPTAPAPAPKETTTTTPPAVSSATSEVAAPSVTSVAAAPSVAPVQETSAAPVETTTSAAAEVPTQPASPLAASPSPAAPIASPVNKGVSNGGGQSYTGKVTFYEQSPTAAGSCGDIHSDDELILAISTHTMGPATHNVMTGESTNSWCGRDVQITYNGNTVVGKVADRCMGCEASQIDLSHGLWKALTGETADPTQGGAKYGVTWSPL